MPITEIVSDSLSTKHTYTDLNYDLMLAENFTLTEGDELINYSWKVINEHTFTDDLNMLQEEDRYYNWYYGYTQIRRPYTDNDGRQNFRIMTSATSGTFTTQYFGEQYQPGLVARRVWYVVFVEPPESVRNNTNVTLHFSLEKVSMTGLGYGYDSLFVAGSSLEAGLTSNSYNFTLPVNNAKGRVGVVIIRRVEEEDFRNIEMEAMPGLRLSWHYTGLGDNVKPDPRYSEYRYSKLFIG